MLVNRSLAQTTPLGMIPVEVIEEGEVKAVVGALVLYGPNNVAYSRAILAPCGHIGCTQVMENPMFVEMSLN